MGWGSMVFVDDSGWSLGFCAAHELGVGLKVQAWGIRRYPRFSWPRVRLRLSLPHSTAWNEPGVAWSIEAMICGRLSLMIGS